MVEGQIPLPAGARIVSQSLSGSRISLALELADGSRAIYLTTFRPGAWSAQVCGEMTPE